MNASTENQPSGSLDFLKWGIIFLILGGAVFGNYYFAEQSVLVRAISVVAAVIVAGLIAMQTEKGRTAVSFAKEAKTEVRKVVWPTRQETLQTTLIVLAVTVVMALILWGIDGIMVRLVRLFTGV